MSSVFHVRENTANLPKLFFDDSGTVDIQRYDLIKYPIFKRLTDNAEANYWRPTEINLTKDAADFRQFSKAEKHFSMSNLQRQIVLDSVQGRAPALCYLPVVSDPWVESFINVWTFMEGIHSKSYTHIIENVYPDASEVYDGMKQIRPILECGDQVSHFYDELMECIRTKPYGSYETKTAFYNSMVATNSLEQIRFHVSFASTFSFGNRNKIEGSCRIMQLIRQDEALHCGFTQNVLKTLPKDDPDFIKIAEEQKKTVEFIYKQVHKQERDWIDYLFMHGPILGLTEQELVQYLDWLVAKSMIRMDLKPDFEFSKKEPLLWMRKYLNEGGDDDQPPPQEEELTSYQTGNINMNIGELVVDF